MEFSMQPQTATLLPMPLVYLSATFPPTHTFTYAIYAVGQHPCDAPTSHVFSLIFFH